MSPPHPARLWPGSSTVEGADSLVDRDGDRNREQRRRRDDPDQAARAAIERTQAQHPLARRGSADAARATANTTIGTAGIGAASGYASTSTSPNSASRAIVPRRAGCDSPCWTAQNPSTSVNWSVTQPHVWFEVRIEPREQDQPIESGDTHRHQRHAARKPRARRARTGTCPTAASASSNRREHRQHLPRRQAETVETPANA